MSSLFESPPILRPQHSLPFEIPVVGISLWSGVTTDALYRTGDSYAEALTDPAVTDPVSEGGGLSSKQGVYLTSIQGSGDITENARGCKNMQQRHLDMNELLY